jgi:hypothetical protein
VADTAAIKAWREPGKIQGVPKQGLGDERKKNQIYPVLAGS